MAGSRAHVHGLVAAGLLSISEAKILLAALDRVADELSSGTLVFQPGDEDVHTAIERRVTEIAGDVGARLHTGRSRNDQIATDLRLFTKRELLVVAKRVENLQRVLLERARTAEDVYLPGYTHLQRAQPVLLAHHLLAHGWAFARDVDRLVATRRRLDVSPLGAGALAGSSLPLDPDRVAAELGFAARFENSLDAVSDRDFVAEALFDLALLGVHLSRLGEEMVLWSSDEFGFVELADAYATGSSMLPQKKNPDIAELARGKSGRVIGHLTGILVTLKGLPLAYNRDLQEDKEPLFDALEQVNAGLQAMAGVLATVTWNETRMRAAADAAFCGGRRPGRVAGPAGHAVSPGPRRRRRPGARRRPAARAPGRAGRIPSRPRCRGGGAAGPRGGRVPADDTGRGRAGAGGRAARPFRRPPAEPAGGGDRRPG